jgi:tetratricopeptide (TPR) repeat protein
VGQVGSEQVWALEAALGAVTEVDSPTRARLLAALGQELVFTGDLDRCRQLSDQALAIARRLGDPATVAAVLASRYHTICGPDTLAERRGNVIELLTAADAIGDPAFRSWALWLAYRAAIESGDVEEADRHLRVNDRLTAELGQPALRWLFCWDRNGRVLLSGDVDGAERLVEEASELGHATGQADAELFSVAQLFQVRFEQGRLEEVESTLAGAVEGTPRMPALRAMQALLLCELGRPAQARTAFDALAGADFADVPVDVYWLRTMTDAATVCAHLGDAARAAVLYHLLAPHANQLVVAIRLVSGCVSHYLGLLATTMDRYDDAEAHFANAEAIHTRIGAPTWAARTRLEWARMLSIRGRAEDTERARALLAQALLSARELALATVERRAVAVLASGEEGQPPPAGRVGGRSA